MSGFFFSLGYVLKRLSRGQGVVAGRGAQLKVGEWQVRPEPLWSMSPGWAPGRGGCVGRGWEGEPARATLICVQL